MACQATHIKFALDLQNKYNIQDLNKFLSGVSYPDSRYVTNIGREMTHDLSRVVLPKNDFEKGWHNHLVCDLTQKDSINSLLPDDFNDVHRQNTHGSDLWIKRTVVKIIQEIEIYQTFDVQPYLSALDYVENHNGEDIGLLEKSNKIIQDIYGNKKNITLNDMLDLNRALGFSEELLEQIKKETEKIMADSRLVSIIQSLYPEMIELAEKY